MGSKILSIAESMATNKFALWVNQPLGENRIAKHIATIDCSKCGKECSVTVEAIYKQRKRGSEKYICKSCSGKKGWTQEKREKASKKASDNWKDPDYAGNIIGKALANEIKILTDEDMQI